MAQVERGVSVPLGVFDALQRLWLHSRGPTVPLVSRGWVHWTGLAALES